MTKAAAFFKTVLTLVGNMAASLTAILWVFLMLAIIAGLVVDLRLLHPDVYKQAMLSAGAYESLPGILAEQSAQPQTQIQTNQSSQAVLQHLNAGDREALYRYLFPPAWLRAQVEGVLDHFFAYVNLQDNKADMSISLSDVRARVQSPDMAIYIAAVMRSLPPCTLEQSMVIIAKLTGGGRLSAEDMCMPPNIDAQTVAALFQSQIASAIAVGIPDHLTIPQLNDLVYSTLNADRLQNLQFARQVLYLSPLLCLLLLLLIVVFAVRSRRSLLRWWGMPLLVTAFLSGAAALSLPFLLSGYLGQSFSGTPRLMDLIMRVSNNLASNISGFVAIFAIGLGGVGVAMMLASYLLRDPHPKGGTAPVTQPFLKDPKTNKRVSPWLVAFAVFLPILLLILAAAALVLWLVSKGMLVL